MNFDKTTSKAFRNCAVGFAVPAAFALLTFLAVPAASFAEPQAGEVRTIELPGGVELEMVYCPAGKYRRGRENYGCDGQPEKLSRGFWIGKYEVTQKQWKAVMGENPSRFVGDDLPVDSVTWEECQTFCKRAGNNLMLPTEAQWEYACRGGPKSLGYKYSGSECDLDAVAWTADNADGHTHPVGTKRANELGLYDMSGNVWEWCRRRYRFFPIHFRVKADPVGPTAGKDRVRRGGSWLSDAMHCTCGFRDGRSPDTDYGSLGFRVAAPKDAKFCFKQRRGLPFRGE